MLSLQLSLIIVLLVVLVAAVFQVQEAKAMECDIAMDLYELYWDTAELACA